VAEDSADRVLIAHEGKDAHALAAAGADERVHLVDIGDHPGPAWGAPAPGRESAAATVASGSAAAGTRQVKLARVMGAIAAKLS
jgi:hypothetical protein